VKHFVYQAKPVLFLPITFKGIKKGKGSQTFPGFTAFTRQGRTVLCRVFNFDC
jgi:hypothetical protein